MKNDSKYWLLGEIQRRSMGFAVLMVSVVLAGCDVRSADEAMTPPPPEVDVARVVAEPVTLTEIFTGRLEAPETVLLRPRVTGYIQEVAFTEGAMVEAGELLFQIDPGPYRAQLNAARAELAQSLSQRQLAETEALRASMLLEKQAISSEEHDQRQAALLDAQARVEGSQAALELAELNMQYTRVVSPITGRAGRAQVTRGNLANADQTLLTTVVSVDPLHVYFDADEAVAVDSRSMFPGNEDQQPVRVGFGGDDAFPHQAALDFVANQLNVNTGTQQFRAVLDNPGGKLRPGQFARVKMPVGELDEALLVDSKAVLTDQNLRYVYVVDASNTVSRRQVTTGREVNNLLIIQDGLEAGEWVIVNGLQKVVAPGMQVIPHQVAMHDAGMSPGDTALANSTVRIPSGQ